MGDQMAESTTTAADFEQRRWRPRDDDALAEDELYLVAARVAALEAAMTVC
jgi:hypothetical protein